MKLYFEFFLLDNVNLQYQNKLKDLLLDNVKGLEDLICVTIYTILATSTEVTLNIFDTSHEFRFMESFQLPRVCAFQMGRKGIQTGKGFQRGKKGKYSN